MSLSPTGNRIINIKLQYLGQKFQKYLRWKLFWNFHWILFFKFESWSQRWSRSQPRTRGKSLEKKRTWFLIELPISLISRNREWFLWFLLISRNQYWFPLISVISVISLWFLRFFCDFWVISVISKILIITQIGLFHWIKDIFVISVIS